MCNLLSSLLQACKRGEIKLGENYAIEVYNKRKLLFGEIHPETIASLKDIGVCVIF